MESSGDFFCGDLAVNNLLDVVAVVINNLVLAIGAQHVDLVRHLELRNLVHEVVRPICWLSVSVSEQGHEQ